MAELRRVLSARSRGCTLAAAVIAHLAAGCAAEVDPVLEVGTGVTRFEPLSEGQSIPMIAGAQGGWHLWVAVRSQGLSASRLRLEVATAPVESGRPRQSSIHVLDLEPRDGWHERAGITAVLSVPECFQDRSVSITAEAIDADRRAARGERVVVPRWSEPIGECGR